MTQSLLERIGACPRCRGALGKSSLPDGRHHYQCQSCGAAWPVVKGIPRFVDSEHYVGSFGWEWRRHKQTQIDDASSRQSEETFAAKTGLTPEDVRGKLVLDVGVGSGRFSHVVARWGGIPVGVDLSLAVLSAHRNLRAFAPNALVLQGDAFRLPFQEEVFDVVFSIGVLHHTPSTRDAFRSVARFCKPGGTVALAVYEDDGHDHYRHSRRYRRATTAMSHSFLHLLSHVAVGSYHATEALRAITPAAADLARFLVPLRDHPDPLWRILDTFDWYSPRFQWLHDEREVVRWFDELGFEEVRRLPEKTMVSVRGTRPRSGPLATPPESEERRLGELAPLPGWIPDQGAARDFALLALLATDVGRVFVETALEHLARPTVVARKLLGAAGP